jgi:ABC-2 type transport system permease protein
MFGQTQQPLSSWQQVRDALQQEYEVRDIDLSAGSVPADVDVLVIVAPQNLDDTSLYAIDQYLMRGGAVMLAAGNFVIAPDAMSGGIAGMPVVGGVKQLLEHYGIYVDQALVLDPQNEPFPVPVVRKVGDYQVQEIQALDYPFFVDVRPDGMAKNNPIVSSLPAVTLNWTSPITVDVAKNANRRVDVLLWSSAKSWLQHDSNIQPDFDLYPQLGFPQATDPQTHTLAISVQGVFESYFKGKPSPLETPPAEGAEVTPPVQAVPATIENSPENARLVVISSAEFVDDIVLRLSAALTRDRYLNSLKLVQNAVSWATEDLDLLAIRARGTTSRVLAPLSEQEESFAEIANYVLALVILMAIGGVSSFRRRSEQPMELLPPEGIAPSEASTSASEVK